MSRTRKVVSGTVMLAAQVAIRMGVTLVIAPLLLRHGSQEVLGSYSIILQLVASLQLLELGVGRALVREIAQLFGTAENRDLDCIKATGFAFLLVVGVAVGLLTVVLAWSLPSWFRADQSVLSSSMWALFLFAVWMPFRFPLSYYQSYLFARQQMALYNGFLIVSEVSRGFFSVLFLYLGCGLPGLAIANILPELIVSVMSWGWIRFKMNERTSWSLPGRPYLRRLLRIGLPLSVMSIGDRLLYQFQDIVAGLALGASSVAAIYTARMPAFFLMTFFSRAMELAVPGLNEVYGEKNMAKFRLLHHRLVSYSLGIALWAGAGIWVYNEFVVRAWLGKVLAPDNGIALSIGFFVVTALLNGILTHFLIVEGKLSRYPFAVVSTGLAGLALSLLFARLFGLKGVFWANTAANLIMTVFLIHRTRLMFVGSTSVLFLEIGERAIRCAAAGVIACVAFNPAFWHRLPWQFALVATIMVGVIGFASFGLTISDRRFLLVRLKTTMFAGT